MKPVKAFYLAYEGTLEEKAYALIGQKIKAAQLLYGESVDSALVEDMGDASLVMELIRAIEAGEDLALKRDARIFAVGMAEVVTESVTGSVVVPSAAICDWREWLKIRGLTPEAVRALQRQRPRKAPPSPVHPAQLTLF